MLEIVNNQEFYCIFSTQLFFYTFYAVKAYQCSNNEIIVIFAHTNSYPNVVHHKLLGISQTGTYTHIETS